MRNEIVKKHILQNRRKQRVRQKMNGTAAKPRISILKSNKHISVQMIDDENHVTICSVSTHSKAYRNTSFEKKSKATARKLGEDLGAIAVKQNIKEAIFDRGPYKYHGILAELADGVRQAGINF